MHSDVAVSNTQMIFGSEVIFVWKMYLSLMHEVNLNNVQNVCFVTQNTLYLLKKKKKHLMFFRELLFVREIIRNTYVTCVVAMRIPFKAVSGGTCSNHSALNGKQR